MAPRTLPPLHPAGIALGVALCGLGVLFADWLLGPLLLRSSTSAEEATLTTVHELLVREYVEPRDQAWIMRRGVQGMIDGLGDPYTYFVEGAEELELLKEESTGRLEGIGVLITGDLIRWPQPASPAEQAGIQPGDRILAVDGVPTAGLAQAEMTRAIKGPPGTTVQLELQRGEQRLTLALERGSVPTGTVDRVEMLDPALGIGGLHVASFAGSTAAELDAALEQLRGQGLRALVLDLRGNAGGLLPAAVAVASRFLRGGVVCTLYARSGAADTRHADPAQGRAADLPLVVLLNGRSASGSEVLAGALRDYGAAVLAGERSYGKGVFQQVYPFREQGFALRFTAGYYVTPAGRMVEGHIDPERGGGLEPDLPAPATPEQALALQAWFTLEEPPAAYRQRVAELFPEMIEVLRRPPDPALDAALAQLRQVLAPS